MMVNKKKTFRTALSLGAAVFLAACQTSQPVTGSPSNASKIDSALERAVIAANHTGGSSRSIGYLEKLYKRNSNDVNAAVNYAEALRENDYLSRAAAVLGPFAKDPSSPSAVKSEYAAIQLAQGEYKRAEEFAQKAILQDEANYKAYHYLGIALDAQAEHEKAERAFRMGLDHWQGDPTAIMNNLALNLASQGFLDEAIEILEKAQSLAPERLEIERNLRIVRALQQSSGGYNAPKPKPRPPAPVKKAPVHDASIVKGDAEDMSGSSAEKPAESAEPAPGAFLND